MLSFDVSEKIILSQLDDYAYNGMEICRILNEFDVYDHKPCNWTCEEKDFFSSKGNCKKKQRGCRISRTTVLYRLNKMKKQGKLSDIKLRWMDRREQGVVDHLPLDVFRIFYTNRGLLSTRLIHDVKTIVGTPEYE